MHQQQGQVVGPRFRQSAAVLGLTINEAHDRTLVKKAGKALVRGCHPDLVPGREGRFQEVRDAWEFLLDADLVRKDRMASSAPRRGPSPAPPRDAEAGPEIYIGMVFEVMALSLDGRELPAGIISGSKAILELASGEPRIGLYLPEGWSGTADTLDIAIGIGGRVIQFYDGVKVTGRSHGAGSTISALWFSPIVLR